MNIMKKTLLVSAVLTALTGCQDDDNSGIVFPKETNEGPTYTTHEGLPDNIANTKDITVVLHEKDSEKTFYLLGTMNGLKSERYDAGTPNDASDDISFPVMKDPNGDFLQVTDLQADNDLTGMDIQGGLLSITPSMLAPTLDSGQSHVVTLTYLVSDGELSTERKAMITITGEDAAPVISPNALAGNFTKDIITGVVDLSTGITDADGEILTMSNIVADPNNSIDINFTIAEDTPDTLFKNANLEFNIAGIKSEIPENQKVTLNFSYDVSDHNNTLTRDFTVNLLGVEDKLGAPLVGDYFLSRTLLETDPILPVNLIEGAIDREDDAIIVQNFEVDGEAGLPYGLTLDGTTLNVMPHAFLTEIAADAAKQMVISYEVADDQGNVANGRKEFTLLINGVESNVLNTLNYDVSFEKGLTSTESGFQTMGWPAASATANVVAQAAKNGINGLSITPYTALQMPLTLEADSQYLFSMWFRKAGVTKPDYVNVMGDGTNRWNGSRPKIYAADTWQEVFIEVDTSTERYLPMTTSGTIYLLNGAAGFEDGNDGHYDDFKMMNVTGFGAAESSILADDVGTFIDENVQVVTTGGGTVKVQADTADDTVVDFDLNINTTGKTGTSVNVELPVKAGAAKAKGRYMFEFDMLDINGPASGFTDFKVMLSTASGSVVTTRHSVANWTQTVKGILNLESPTGTPDWENEDVTLTLMFTDADAQINVDNVVLYAIP